MALVRAKVSFKAQEYLFSGKKNGIFIMTLTPSFLHQKFIEHVLGTCKLYWSVAISRWMAITPVLKELRVCVLLWQIRKSINPYEMWYVRVVIRASGVEARFKNKSFISESNDSMSLRRGELCLGICSRNRI